jgi:WD40 repeat protein
MKNPGHVAWSPNALNLAVASTDSLVVMDAKTGERRWQARHAGTVFTAVAWGNEGNGLFTGTADGKLAAWNFKSETPVAIVQAHVGPVDTLAFSADGTRLASAGDDRSVALWEPVNLKEQGRARAFNTRARALSFFPADPGCLMLGTHDGLLFMWETGSSKAVGGAP